MSDVVHIPQTGVAGGGVTVLPQPRCPISVRPGTDKDIPFIDQLQKTHGNMVGWMPTAQLEGKIKLGHVLIAETIQTQRRGGTEKIDEADKPSVPSCLRGESVGYCIGNDQYSGRDDVGIIYQLNVLPLKQRHLIGATLIKAMFDRAAYGCRLFCCWCAQDIQANYFWESIGFVPLAFRTGSRTKGAGGGPRMHIFWQRRIRENDTTTPWWFPSQTKSGAIREDRLVLPIPPGTHWRDAKPIVLPGAKDAPAQPALPKQLPGGAPVRPRPEQPRITTAHRMAVVRSESTHLRGLPRGKAAVITGGGLRYIDRGDYVPEPAPPKPARPPRSPAAKHDPKQVAFVRELRDRYLEQVNTDPTMFALAGKYDVSRAMTLKAPAESCETRALPAPLAA